MTLACVWFVIVLKLEGPLFRKNMVLFLPRPSVAWTLLVPPGLSVPVTGLVVLIGEKKVLSTPRVLRWLRVLLSLTREVIPPSAAIERLLFPDLVPVTRVRRWNLLIPFLVI